MSEVEVGAMRPLPTDLLSPRRRKIVIFGIGRGKAVPCEDWVAVFFLAQLYT